MVGNYVGLSEEKAKRMVAFDGLTVCFITQESESYDAGYVAVQSISPGAKVSQGTQIQLVLSSGRPVNLMLPIPQGATQPFVATAYYNGECFYTSGFFDPTAVVTKDEMGNLAVKLPLHRSAANFSDSDVSILVKYNDARYCEYAINFDNGSYTLIQQYSLSQS